MHPLSIPFSIIKKIEDVVVAIRIFKQPQCHNVLVKTSKQTTYPHHRI